MESAARLTLALPPPARHRSAFASTLEFRGQPGRSGGLLVELRAMVCGAWRVSSFVLVAVHSSVFLLCLRFFGPLERPLGVSVVGLRHVCMAFGSP